MNEDTEKMINFLSEIRKLHRQQEDLINQVYLQDEVWKTIEEMVCNFLFYDNFVLCFKI